MTDPKAANLTVPIRYPDLHPSGALDRRAAALATACRACPHQCNVDRLGGAFGRCGAATRPGISAAYPHFGEEPCLVGRTGSGTIFFAGCNLRCVFCQNAALRFPEGGPATTIAELSAIMLDLQSSGCANLNLVTPTPHAAAILQALDLAAGQGLVLPLVWNSSAFESPQLLDALDGVVDIYLPDFKTADPERAKRWLGTPDYPEAALDALRRMAAQVGPLALAADGSARRGLLVRHLVLPQGQDDSCHVLEQLARAIPGTAVHVMGQYRPMAEAARHPPLDARPDPGAVAHVRRHAAELGLRLV